MKVARSASVTFPPTTTRPPTPPSTVSTTTTPTPVITLSCPHPKGFFPHPTDCKKFVNCWGGRPAVQVCAEGTLFNAATRECDHASKVVCLSTCNLIFLFFNLNENKPTDSSHYSSHSDFKSDTSSTERK
jgi:hypothetical protein